MHCAPICVLMNVAMQSKLLPIVIEPMQKTSKKCPRRCGFTLVELLVVITIIVALAADTFVAVRAIRAKANAATSASNIKQLYDGHMLYLAEYTHFPSQNDWTSKIQAEAVANCQTWHERLAPYVGLGADLEETQQKFIPETAPPGVFQVPGRKRLLEDNERGGFRSGYVRSPRIYQNDDSVSRRASFKDLVPFSRLSASFFLIDTGGDSPETDFNGWEISNAARLKWPAHGGKPGTLDGNVVICYLDGHVESPKKGELSANYRDKLWSPPMNQP